MTSTSEARIKPLSENIVNQIAAGEVVQRPAFALKELIENSIDAGALHHPCIFKARFVMLLWSREYLDVHRQLHFKSEWLRCAGASRITVVVNEGGLKLLQIKDDGCGIHAEDFPILCHRHTTSKLTADEDLKKIQTLGFRGEALCSISFVSRLKIVSMRAEAQMGHRAEFRDSEMTTAEPERCAAVQGTLITAEDMFYNVPNRLKAMSSATQEFHLIYDVVAKYAVFCTGAPCPSLLL